MQQIMSDPREKITSPVFQLALLKTASVTVFLETGLAGLMLGEPAGLCPSGHSGVCV